MEKLILKKAMMVYNKKIGEDREFALTQFNSKASTAKEIVREFNNFKIQCCIVSDKDINYPDTYTDLQIRIIYFGLYYLKDILSERTIDLNREFLLCEDNEERAENILIDMNINLAESVACNKLYLEFLNLYFDSNGKVKIK